MTQKDNLFQTPQPQFEFNQNVVTVFDNMINRSVPHYSEFQHEIAWLVDALASPNTCIYDLGCSIGTTYLTLAPILKSKNLQYIGIDNSEAMLKKAMDIRPRNPQPQWHNNDLNHPIDFQPASIIILNLVLQFLRPENRLPLLTRIHQSLLPNGYLILIEKIIPSPAHFDLFTTRYHHFKKSNGYTEDEITNKAKSLQNVLIPDSLTTHQSQLKQAGFSTNDTFFQWYNFAGILAKK